MPHQVAITVSQGSARAKLIIDCEQNALGKPSVHVQPSEVTTTPMTPAQSQVLRGEIMAGLLTGCKKASGSWSFRLVHLSAFNGDQEGLLTIPSIAYAVAASLAAAHGSEVENLLKDPHGGHGWELDHIDAIWV